MTAVLDWSARPAADVLAAVRSRTGGLTDEEARDRLAVDGPNLLRRRRGGALGVLARQFRNAVLILLIVSAALAGLLGDAVDAVIIGVILLASVGLGFAEEYAAERTTARLQDSMAHQALVVRGGRARSIPVTELVVGDVVHLTMGSRVPADLRMLETHDLSCDESVLTGEQSPSVKSSELTSPGAALAERTALAYQGTIVRSGSATGVVVATGAGTEIGRIAQQLGGRLPETAFQAGLRRFSLLLMWVAAGLVATVLLTSALLHRPIFDSLLFALAIAVGITPQLLPAVVNTSLAAGARRLARRKVVVKRLVCIEDLGNIEVLVTDKTGTLTTGEIEFLASLDPAGTSDQRVAEIAVATIDPAGTGAGSTDALDAALVSAAGVIPAATIRLPFDHARRCASGVGPDGVLVCKGAPDAILPLCDDVPSTAAEIVRQQLAQGARLLAVASKPFDGGEITAQDEHGLALRGFLTFSDATRPEAAAAIQRLEGLGIRLIVATGDHPAVAETVCTQLGIRGAGTLTGAELDALDDDALATALRETAIVARVSPEQKARVVSVLRRSGAVAFLGDGVNDALALHDSDVGISVDTATDVAKDAADVVLLEKSLAVLADGVEQGRRIFRNTLKYVYMAASGNLGNMISAAAASAFLPFLPMLPGQILLGNLLYDASQLTISTDRVDRDALRQPSKWDIGLIGRFMLVFGPLSTFFDLATFATLIGVFHATASEFRSGWFVESLASQALVVLVIRTHRFPFLRSRPGTALLIAVLVVAGVAVLLPFAPFAVVLGMQPLPIGMLLALGGLVVAYLVVADIAKRLFFRREDRPARPTVDRRLHRAVGGLVR
jgi:Mg2+-importing ATPase